MFCRFEKTITFAFLSKSMKGTIAQLVEQRTENPCVAGSIPAGTTKKCRNFFLHFFFAQHKK